MNQNQIDIQNNWFEELEKCNYYSNKNSADAVYSGINTIQKANDMEEYAVECIYHKPV